MIAFKTADKNHLVAALQAFADYLTAIQEGQEAVVRTARKVFPLVEKASDEPSADLLTQRMQVHEKTAWMLRALLEK